MEEKKVVLRDLDALLKNKLGESLVVDSFTTSSLVAPGENYGSTMLKVDALIRREETRFSKSQELFLVAKMVPPTEFQKTMFEIPVTFAKEVYMFEKIVPAYKDLDRECGIPEAEVFDLLPEFFGSRLSLQGDGNNVLDDDAVILMENLKVKNYACGDRTIGFDLAHARSAVVALARFHATGIAMKLKKPKLLDRFRAKAQAADITEKVLRSGAREFIKSNLRRTPALLPHLARVERVVLRTDDSDSSSTSIEPWGTIVHGDFWTNNIMFRDSATGLPEDVKFVDFQTWFYRNPMRDLVCFLFLSCEDEMRQFHIEYLINLYYEKFVSHLARLKCDLHAFSRDSFDEQFAAAANLEYLRCMLMVKVLHVDVKKDLVDPEQMFQIECTDKCGERMGKITLEFIKENWI